MGLTIRELISRPPVIIGGNDTLQHAAQLMRAQHLGDVLVKEDGSYGIVTDRDLVIRAMAENREPAATKVSEIATHNLCSVQADAKIEDAIRLMRARSVRRIVVCDGKEPIGVVSLGDLALARDRSSVLADISGSPPQN